MKKISFLLILGIAFQACQTNTEAETNTEENEDWIVLFDGVSTDGWRAYNGDSIPPGWIAKDGELTFDTELGLEQNYTGGTDIIYGLEEFENFELYLEWKIPAGGNSGIFYHLKENIPNAGPPDISPEYQLIDDENYTSIHDITEYNISVGFTDNPSSLQPLQSTAADYAMYAPDTSKKVLHPTGEWNSSKIVFTPEQVEHWLNGQKVVSFKPWTEEWDAKRNAGKWHESPHYGAAKTGYIGLQDHESPIWFRNIKIKKL